MLNFQIILLIETWKRQRFSAKRSLKECCILTNCKNRKKEILNNFLRKLQATSSTNALHEVVDCCVFLAHHQFHHQSLLLFFTLDLKHTFSWSLFHHGLLHRYSLDWSHGLPAGPFSFAHRFRCSISFRLRAVD